MTAIILNILRIAGIFILVLLGTVLILILLVLFVPVRYTLAGCKDDAREMPLTLRIKVTWLFHLLNLHFRYPDAAYLKVRILCFTVFRSDQRSDHQEQITGETAPDKPESNQEVPIKEKNEEPKIQAEPAEKPKAQTAETAEGNTESEDWEQEEPGWLDFFKKLISFFRNIKYTITKICDKIKHIVKNIKYYLEILKSDQFKNAFSVCKTQVFTLLKSMRPRKVKGSLLIGTGDPASTGQVLAVYGILYPVIGDHISLTPDFEHSIIEGDLFIKGKITVFCLLRAAWIIFFNKDIRRVIKLLKREAA